MFQKRFGEDIDTTNTKKARVGQHVFQFTSPAGSNTPSFGFNSMLDALPEWTIGPNVNPLMTNTITIYTPDKPPAAVVLPKEQPKPVGKQDWVLRTVKAIVNVSPNNNEKTKNFTNPKDFWKNIGPFRSTTDDKKVKDSPMPTRNSNVVIGGYEGKREAAKRICSMCFKQLEDDEEGIIFTAKLLHDSCLVCSSCYLPLAFATVYINANKPYCKVDNPAAPEVTRDPGFRMDVTVQPERFQIANYNVYAAPQITFNVPVPHNVIVTATLIENQTQSTVPNGFLSGHIQEMPHGSQSKTFTSLKLCKKSHVKSYLKEKNLKHKEVTFCIRFSVGNLFWHSRSFRLLSSCSQLPTSERDAVRPFATNWKGENPDSLVSSPVSPGSCNGTPMSLPSSPIRDVKMTIDFMISRPELQ